MHRLASVGFWHCVDREYGCGRVGAGLKRPRHLRQSLHGCALDLHAHGCFRCHHDLQHFRSRIIFCIQHLATRETWNSFGTLCALFDHNRVARCGGFLPHLLGRDTRTALWMSSRTSVLSSLLLDVLQPRTSDPAADHLSRTTMALQQPLRLIFLALCHWRITEPRLLLPGLPGECRDVNLGFHAADYNIQSPTGIDGSFTNSTLRSSDMSNSQGLYLCGYLSYLVLFCVLCFY